MTTAEIVEKYRYQLGDGKRASLRKFADALSEFTLPHCKVDKATIHTWTRGTQPIYFEFVYLALHTQGWAADMAREILAVMRPDIWGKN